MRWIFPTFDGLCTPVCRRGAGHGVFPGCEFSGFCQWNDDSLASLIRTDVRCALSGISLPDGQHPGIPQHAAETGDPAGYGDPLRSGVFACASGVGGSAGLPADSGLYHRAPGVGGGFGHRVFLCVCSELPVGGFNRHASRSRAGLCGLFNRRAQSGGHGKGGCIAPSAGPGISRYGVAVALPTHHAFGAGRCGGGTFCPPPLAVPSCRGRRGLGVAWPGVVFVPPPEK